MKRILLNTITEKLVKSNEVRIYGNSIIRKELRDTPKGFIDDINLRNDFLIIACASLKNLDVVVSEDVRSALSDFALKSYEVGIK